MFKNRNTHIFAVFFVCVKCCMALYFNMTMPDPKHHATSHSSSPMIMSKILPWHSMSPDLNPNKHTGNRLERCVRGKVNAPATVCELFQALKQEWVAIPAQVIDNLIQSMPERCWAVIDSRGHIPY